VKFSLGGVLALVLVAAATPASSHHSFSMFERDKQITLRGTVKEFQWTNPHSWIQLTVPGASGAAAVEWAIEGGSPNQLVRTGWAKDSLKPGDQVTVVTKPLRNGGPGGSLVSVTLPTGQVLGERPPAGAEGR
jgi:hypothetical protein